MAKPTKAAHNPQAVRKPSSKPTVARFGEYELVEKVGEGGMAEVWLARREGIGGSTKSCAIKLPLERHSDDDRFRRMFLSEARLALKLAHANIVSVFDAGEVDGRLYMALEWIDGVDLRSFAQRIHDIPMRFSFAVVCHIVGELLQGLRYAHTFAIGGKSLGIIHRDVSPQNVLISSSGEVKLSDFGIARVIGEETSQMHVKGKLRYMAPEQFHGTPEQASDLYAVGTIMHELIEGRRFRDGLESREDWMRVLMSDAMPPLTRRGVPPAIAALHDGLLQADPAKRLRTADDALNQLHLCDEWRNATIELRKMYSRYFNVNRRTGLTQGDGELLAVNDADIAAHAQPLPGLEPASPDGPEPDAPVFFRKGPRRGALAADSGMSATAEPHGRPPSGGSSGPVSGPVSQASGAAQSAAAMPTDIGSGPTHHQTARPSGSGAAASSPVSDRESTRPRSRPEETHPDAIDRHEATSTTAGAPGASAPNRRNLVLIAAFAIGAVGATGGTIMMLQRDEVPASPAAPLPAPGAAADPTAAVHPGKPADGADVQSSAGVVVKLRLSSVQEAWVRIGTREIFVNGRIDEKLPAGDHEVAWRIDSEAPWSPADPLTVTEGKEHLVTIGTDGLTFTAYDL